MRILPMQVFYSSQHQLNSPIEGCCFNPKYLSLSCPINFTTILKIGNAVWNMFYILKTARKAIQLLGCHIQEKKRARIFNELCNGKKNKNECSRKYMDISGNHLFQLMFCHHVNYETQLCRNIVLCIHYFSVLQKTALITKNFLIC